MLTLFSLPKPFTADAARSQAVAVASWAALGVQVVLVGDEDGIADAAERLGVEHVADVTRSENGTPRLDDAFARVDAIARYPLRLFVNADVVLLPDVLDATRRLDGRFLLVGQTRELEVHLSELRDVYALRARAMSEGVLRGPTAIDWFVFPAGLFDPLPAFVVGRSSFDNWLIWRARQSGNVVDATADVVAIHQPHGYGHLAGGKDEAYYGEEARENMRLGGGKSRVYTLHDASHRLVGGRLHRNLGAVLRVRETVRRVAFKVRA
jgi:hypothetical protein